MSELDFAVRIGLERAGQFDDRRIRATVTDYHLRRIAGMLDNAYHSRQRQFESPGLLEALADTGAKEPGRQDTVDTGSDT